MEVPTGFSGIIPKLGMLSSELIQLALLPETVYTHKCNSMSNNVVTLVKMHMLAKA